MDPLATVAIDTQCPTNKKNKKHELALPRNYLETGFGIDWITIHSDIANIDPSPDEWTTSSLCEQNGVRRFRTQLHLTGGQSVDLRARYHEQSGTGAMTLMLNPSSGRDLRGAAEALTTLQEAWKRSTALVTPTTDLPAARISRLDIASDITPWYPMAEAKARLAGTPPAARWQQHMYPGAGDRGWSVYHRTKSVGQSYAYDKGSESGTNEELIRLETRLVHVAIRRAGLPTVGHLTGRALRRAHLARCKHFMSSLEADFKLERVLRSPHSPYKIRAALGDLALREAGIELTDSASRRREYQAIRQDLGITRLEDLKR